MVILISSDSPTVAMRLRKALAAQGHDCPITHVVGLDQTEGALQSTRQAVDLLLVVLPADEHRTLGLLRSLRKATSARIVAVGNARSPKHILETLHAGADDFLDDEADVGEQVAASLERLTIQPGTTSGGVLVAVTSASGGSGCSTLAASLAVTLAGKAGTCGLIDLASGFGDLAALFNLTPRHTLGDLLRNEEALDRDMLIQSLTAHDSGVRLLASPSQRGDAHAATPHALERIVQLSRGIFPWCVLDLDYRNPRHTSVLRDATLILLVLRLDFASLCNTRRLLDEWDQQQIDVNRVHLIANRCGQVSEIPHDQIQPLLGKKAAVSLPEDVHAANIAINCGNPVVLELPKSPLSKAIGTTAGMLLGNTADKSERNAPEQSRPTIRPDGGMLRRAAGILFC